MLLLHHGDEKKRGHTDSYCSVLHNTYHLLKYNYTGHLGEFGNLWWALIPE